MSSTDRPTLKPRCKHGLTEKTCARCLGLPIDPLASRGLDGGHWGGCHIRGYSQLGLCGGAAFLACDGDEPANNAGSLL